MQQSFNIHICKGDQIHLYHLLSNFTAISHYSVCFYCLNSMFTKSIYCHMYVHRYGSIYWCVSSPSEPESLKNTDILLQQVSTASTSSEGAGPPPSSSLGFWRAWSCAGLLRAVPAGDRVHMLFSCRLLLALPLKIFIPTLLWWFLSLARKRCGTDI